MLYWPDKIIRQMAIIFLFVMQIQLSAQVGSQYFSGDPANLYDWRSTMINPAIGVFQTGALEMGFKIHHLGFMDNNSSAFKSSYALINLPRRLPHELGFGLQTLFFDSPIFNEFELKMSLNRQIRPGVAIGISAGVRNIAYNRSRFNLVDQNDPVFAGKTSRWQPDFGLGVSFIPSPQASLGVSVSHFNRPSISLIDDDLRLNPTLQIGLAVSFGGYTLHTGSRFDKHTTPHGFIQFYDSEIGLLQAGMNEFSPWIKGRINVRGPFSVGYGFSYPVNGLAGTSSGNHETFIVYEFDKLRKLPRINFPVESRETFQPDMPGIDVVPQYFVKTSADRLDIYAKELVREFDDNLTAESVSKLTKFDVGVLDTSYNETVFPFSLPTGEIDDSSQTPNPNYSRSYRKSLKQLREDFSDKKTEVVLITPKHQRKRAFKMGNYLKQVIGDSLIKVALTQPAFKNSHDSARYFSPIQLEDLKRNDNLMIIKPRSVIFSVYPVLSHQLSDLWKLVVEDKSGGNVFTHTNGKTGETEVSWDWRDTQGKIIEPGLYRYYIAWKDGSGNERRSAPRILYARKLKRSIHIKVTRSYQKPEGGVDKVGIILNK